MAAGDYGSYRTWEMFITMELGSFHRIESKLSPVSSLLVFISVAQDQDGQVEIPAMQHTSVLFLLYYTRFTMMATDLSV